MSRYLTLLFLSVDWKHSFQFLAKGRMVRHVGELYIVLALAACANGQASPTASPVNDSSANQQTKLVNERPKLESLIQITLRTSRSQVTAGSGFGIVADVHNKSEESVYLRPKYFTMTPPPEIDPGGFPSVWWALIPPQQDDKTNYEEVIHLGPGAQTTAFWSGNQPGQTEHLWDTFFNLVTFPPGEYTIKVVGSYWTDWESAHNQANNYRTETAEIKVLVAAPQSVILFGSLIGGLIAYFLLPYIRLHPQRIDLSGLFTAVLVSSIVTILLARLSETQFLIRITINDFWGAIAIGFVASASGTSLLQRFLPKTDATSQKTPGRVRRWLGRKKGTPQDPKELKHAPVGPAAHEKGKP